MDAAGVVALGRLAPPHRRRRPGSPDERDRQGDAQREHSRRPPSRRLVAEPAGDCRRRPAAGPRMAVRDGRARSAPTCSRGLWPDFADEPQIVRIALASRRPRARRERRRRREPTRRPRPGVPSLAAIAAHATRTARTTILDKLSEAVSLFERSPRSLALAAAYEDLGLAQQRRADVRLGDRRPHPGSGPASRGPGRLGMLRDSEAASESSGFAAGSRETEKPSRDGQR